MRGIQNRGRQRQHRWHLARSIGHPLPHTARQLLNFRDFMQFVRSQCARIRLGDLFIQLPGELQQLIGVSDDLLLALDIERKDPPFDHHWVRFFHRYRIEILARRVGMHVPLALALPLSTAGSSRRLRKARQSAHEAADQRQQNRPAQPGAKAQMEGGNSAIPI